MVSHPASAGSPACWFLSWDYHCPSAIPAVVPQYLPSDTLCESVARPTHWPHSHEPPRPQSCDCRDPGPGRGNKTDTDRSRQPGDIPTPHLIGAAGTVGTQGLVLWCFTATSVVVLLCLSQDPVEGRLRGQITSLIGQDGHNLTRWQTTECRAVTHRKDDLPFLGTEFVGRYRSFSTGTSIT